MTNLRTKSQRFKIQSPPARKPAKSTPTVELDTVSALAHDPKDGFGKVMGSIALLGLAVAATGCTPQTPVEQVTVQENTTETSKATESSKGSRSSIDLLDADFPDVSLDSDWPTRNGDARSVVDSDGTVATRIGDTVVRSDGTSSTRIGNTIINSDGTITFLTKGVARAKYR